MRPTIKSRRLGTKALKYYLVLALAIVPLVLWVRKSGKGDMSRIPVCRVTPVSQVEPLCRVVEVVYADGPKTCGEIVVYTDGTYIWRQRDVWSEARSEITYSGRLDAKLFDSLKDSVEHSRQWEQRDGIATLFMGVDDTKSERPVSVQELWTFLYRQHALN